MERNWIIPPDVVEDILSRLPIRDLLQIRCVSKEWRAIIDDISFIKKHYQVRYSICKVGSSTPNIIKEFGLDSLLNNVCLLYTCQDDVITLILAGDIDRDSKAVLPYPYEAYQYNIDCHGCVNGIVCLSFRCKKSPKIQNGFLALWNPATREFKTIAYPNVSGLLFCRCFGILGFGFDLLSNDFKILGTTDIRIQINPREEKSISYHAIYSLKTNSWKQTQIPPADLIRVSNTTTDGYLNGVYYWTRYLPYHGELPSNFEIESFNFTSEVFKPSNFEIVSFNFTSEVFKVSNAPQEAVSLVSKGNSYQAMIALYKEHLALVVSHEVKDVALCNIDIWVVTQFDDDCVVPLSWQRLFTIEGSPDQLNLKVDTILMNGDLLLTCVDRGQGLPICAPRKSYHYDCSRGKFKRFNTCLSACFRYVESLFPISRRLVQT